MGKNSRRKAQRREHLSREKATYKVTIVTQPSTDRSAAWAAPDDIPLVRSAVLYADSIELLSQRYFWADFYDILAEKGRMISDGVADPNQSFLQMYVEGQLDNPRGKELAAGIDDIIRRHRIDRNLPLEKLRLAIQRAREVDRPREEAERQKVAERNGLPVIRRLKELGLLQISESGLNYAPGPMAFHPQTWEAGWWEELVKRVESGSARLLLDAKSQVRLAQAIKGGLVQPSALFEARTGEVGIGTGLIARLPAFPSTPVEELLDLRSDLSEPLIRYRAAAMRLSRASGITLGPDSQERINDLWVTDVRPEILAIEEQLRDHSLVREMAKSAGKDVKTFLLEGASIGIGISALTELASWVAALASVVAPGAQSAYSGWLASQEGKTAAKRADLFYLYAASSRMEAAARK